MADNYVQLPVDGSGKKLDTEQITVGANTVHRERDQIAGTGADDIAVVTDADPSPSVHGLVVRPLNVENPIRSALSTVALAAGASVDLDGAAIASGKTGKLQSIYVSSTVPGKWHIKTRDGAVETTIGVLFTGGLAGQPTAEWTPPDKRYDTIAHVGGDENFRVTVTNLDSENAADFYATLYFDECD